MKKSLFQMIKFALVSGLVTIIQLVLVNVFFFLMKDWHAPLPPVLASIFSEEAVGTGNSEWGYILPFFLSNLIANAYGFFQNRKTTFHSNAPKRNVILFLLIVSVLIVISTWVQGRIVYLLSKQVPSLKTLAPTIAAFAAGLLQFVILFPLEKYVLLKEG